MTDQPATVNQTSASKAHAAAGNLNPELDTRPAIVRAVENWNRALNLSSTGTDHRTEPQPPTGDDRDRLEAAARSAPHVYHGPTGELIQRELRAAVDFGYRTGRDALLPRLADQVLSAERTPAGTDDATSADHAPNGPVPPRSTPIPRQPRDKKAPLMGVDLRRAPSRPRASLRLYSTSVVSETAAGNRTCSSPLASSMTGGQRSSFARTLPRHQPDRVATFGSSLGGGNALAAAGSARFPTRLPGAY
ncbi:MAG: hypothetical protein ACRDZO_19570, partial [Egibacteraceae bacterium]